MVPTAIHFESSGIISLFFFFYLLNCLLRVKNIFRRQLDGLLHMEVLMALLNLLGAVSPCKGFFIRIYGSYLGV